MKIAVIGASGRAGSRIARELASRGHQVTGIARNIQALEPIPGLAPVQCDATEGPALALALAGHDVVVSASRFRTSNAESLIAAVKQAGAARLLLVGGAGSMEVSPGVRLFDTPEFPEKNKPESGAGIAFLERLRKESDLDWTFLCPNALFDPEGPKTGVFRLGGDQLMYDANGKSWISMDDFAIAMADEVASHRYPRQRFSVGY